MKIFFYQANSETAPFDESFRKELGFNNSDIFFSKEESVIKDHLGQVKVMLRNRINKDCNIFINFEHKNMFIKLIKSLFHGNLKEVTPPDKPSKEELNITNETKFSRFYDKMESREVFITETTTEGELKKEATKISEVIEEPVKFNLKLTEARYNMTEEEIKELLAQDDDLQNKNDELQSLINKLVNNQGEPNEIDRIFFATVGTKGTGSIVRLSERHNDPKRQFLGPIIENILGGLEKLDVIIRQLNRGNLDYNFFKFGDTENGGMICLSIVPGADPKLWLGFVSATYHGERVFLNFRQASLSKILKLSKNDMLEYYP
ncbi:MAG: hypothetical protein VSS75_020185 [Candidatus Parabeggiatoa sp.]|nr:hypothetical protein [Candidatus Parabeggiatoa sp.]